MNIVHILGLLFLPFIAGACEAQGLARERRKAGLPSSYKLEAKKFLEGVAILVMVEGLGFAAFLIAMSL